MKNEEREESKGGENLVKRKRNKVRNEGTEEKEKKKRENYLFGKGNMKEI